jgi:hypothetical protein
MKANTPVVLASSVALAVALCASGPTRAAEASLDCRLSYSITGWSVIYKHSEGRGTVSCANGASMPVRISAKGVGLTAGKWRIDNGRGDFSHVHSISDMLGDYAHAEAHAGAVKSASAQVLTKGKVSLALAGTGRGVDLGVDVGEFTLSPAD